MKKLFSRAKILQCNPMMQFTCWNGDCISLVNRCNARDDCTDGSDEHKCTLVTMDEEKYRKVFVPKNPSIDSKLNVVVGFDVIDIVEINEPKVIYMEK